MKKIMVILAAALLILSIASCKKSENGGNTSESGNAGTSTHERASSYSQGQKIGSAETSETDVNSLLQP